VSDVTRTDLALHTTLRLGGPPARLVTAIHPDEIIKTVRQVRTAGESSLVVAGGSNVVIADDGVPGTVVLVRTSGIAIVPAPEGDDHVLVTVEAGQPWDDVVALAVTESLAGIECLSGIPGSAGATPIQNVGAYGQEVSECIVGVRVFDTEADEVREMPPSACGFAYRTSQFKHNDRYVVLSVTFRLRRSAVSGPIRYAELARAVDVPLGATAPLAEVRAAVLDLRARKGMVLDPLDPDTYSVGSFFTNPVLERQAFAALCARAGTEPPAWPGPDGTVKVSAAWLIERAGFTKGYAGGRSGVAVSGKHTLALTNRGTGTTAALLDLAREIRDGVVKAFDVELHPEPVLIGCSL
jgi:UDP-N-acetylmuramate dehydrogenase